MSDHPDTWYLVATDDGSDAVYTTVREAGFDLASDAGSGVILYDRTTESKLTNPYPSGPWSDEGDALSPEDELGPRVLREMGRAYLAEQVEAGRARGIATRAHLAVDTGAQALSDAIGRYRPTAVVFPAGATDEGGLLERITDSTVGDALEETSAKVILIDESGERVS